jgi:RecQ-mediated genome instability protein 1
MSIKPQLRSAILAQSLPPPSDTLLTSLITARNPPPPLPSLLATARARLLACDLTSSTAIDTTATAVLPTPPGGRDDDDGGGGGGGYLATPELKITTDVYVQVVDVENLSLSRWEQIEELEAVEKGETTRGREIIRVIDDGDENGENGATQTGTASSSRIRQRSGTSARQGHQGTAQAGKNATHRLAVQDRTGRRLYALELRRIESVGVGKTNIGEKILLRAGTVIARGTILLTPDNCVLLGGKIEAWHKSWVDGRLTRLKEAVQADR